MIHQLTVETATTIIIEFVGLDLRVQNSMIALSWQHCVGSWIYEGLGCGVFLEMALLLQNSMSTQAIQPHATATVLVPTHAKLCETLKQLAFKPFSQNGQLLLRHIGF